MKRKKVKRSVGNKDQMLRVERFEMVLRGVKQRLFEPLRVGRAHAKFRKLESQQLQEMKDAREDGDGRDFDVISGDNGGNEPVSRRIVFDESCAVRESGLQFFEGKTRRSFQRGVFTLLRGQLTQRAQKFVFVGKGFFL